MRDVGAYISMRYINTNNKLFLAEEDIFYGYQPPTPLLPLTPLVTYYLLANVISDILNTILTICSEYSIIFKKILEVFFGLSINPKISKVLLHGILYFSQARLVRPYSRVPIRIGVNRE